MMMKHTSRKETAGAAANMKLCIPSVPSSNLPYFLKPSLPSLFRPVIFPFFKSCIPFFFLFPYSIISSLLAFCLYTSFKLSYPFLSVSFLQNIFTPFLYPVLPFFLPSFLLSFSSMFFSFFCLFIHP